MIMSVQEQGPIYIY